MPIHKSQEFIAKAVETVAVMSGNPTDGIWLEVLLLRLSLPLLNGTLALAGGGANGLIVWPTVFRNNMSESTSWQGVSRCVREPVPDVP